MSRKPTIRQQVIAFALDRPFGFTDSDLKAAFPESPESSYRKRRTELAQENFLIAHGDTKANEHNEAEQVWRHRDHCFCPPPLRPRDSAPPTKYQLLREENERLRSELADLRQTVITFAAPHAVTFARERCFPAGHLHPVHYDVLQACGARMDDFVRGEAS